jgi:hypothetical protein
VYGSQALANASRAGDYGYGGCPDFGSFRNPPGLDPASGQPVAKKAFHFGPIGNSFVSPFVINSLSKSAQERYVVICWVQNDHRIGY